MIANPPARITKPGRLVCIGSYTGESGGRGKGMTLFRQTPATGELAMLDELSIPSPSYLAWHPSLPIVYATSEAPSGQVHAVRCDESLNLMGSVASGGAAPCHIALTVDGRFLLCAHYGGGGVTVLPVAVDGTLHDPIASVAHEQAHMALPNGGTVLTTDLALDQVRRYWIGDAGRLELDRVWQLPAGTGPRHVAHDPVHDRLFVVGELDSTVSILDATGVVGRYPATSTTPATRNFPANIEYRDAHRLLFVSNRGADRITTFAVTSDGLDVVGEDPVGAAWPRHFATIGSWLYVAAERSDTITCFAADARTGRLRPTSRRAAVASPTCIAAAPLGRRIIDSSDDCGA